MYILFISYLGVIFKYLIIIVINLKDIRLWLHFLRCRLELLSTRNSLLKYIMKNVSTEIYKHFID